MPVISATFDRPVVIPIDSSGNPLGVAGNPLVVSGGGGGGGGGGDASAANQALEIAALGAPGDAAWSGTGTGSITAALKAIWARLGAAGLAAGELHLGAVGGEGAHPFCTPAATALSYSSGKCIGGINVLAGFLRASSRSALIQSATLRSKVTITAAIDLVIFRDLPTVTTGLADGATFAVDPADVGKVSRILTFGAWSSLGSASIATLDGIGRYTGLASGVDARCILVARGAVTLTSASDLTAALGVAQD